MTKEKKILVVDDEPDIVKVVKMRLEHEGYKVITLTSSAQAVEVVQNEKPDLVLLDIMMPGKDGYQVCDQIKTEISNEIPVIVFSAKPLEKDLIKEAHRAYGADDYITKPFDVKDLLVKIRNLIN